MKYLVLILTLALCGQSHAQSFQIQEVGSPSAIGSQTPARGKILLYLEQGQTSLFRQLNQAAGARNDVLEQISINANHFPVTAVARFRIQRSSSTVSPATLLARADLQSICRCTISSFSSSSGRASFNASTKRVGQTLTSSSALQAFTPGQVSGLAVNTGFLRSVLGYNAPSAGHVTYQFSDNFSTHFAASQVVSFYFPLGDDQIEVVSLAYSLFHSRPGSFILGGFKGVLKSDLRSIARAAERNGRR